ncbi:hypothetical protein like AT5G19440 [Hibiscus trionum]|uniref:NAD(P)-binding domain-containing protein n=1 Tax=Hibiscus trionum TaxID=183268 RepID=A0A9W7GYI9_HIBTR|nr:hypothetical protein like AT5G19440 [Hibiscus trionum]
MNAAEKVVCVTGASGYSWLVKLLLQRVRDPNDPKKTEHLVSLDGAKERLHLFKGCFDSIVDGCQGVFHTASPVILSATDPQRKAAWRFAKDNRIDLVVLNPGFVTGPLLQPARNTTSESVLSLTRGENTFPTLTYRFVDVRDVAYARILAFEIPSATGRYCLVDRNVQFGDQDKPLERIFRISQEKAKSLGLSFIPWGVSLRETIESLKEKGFLSI